MLQRFLPYLACLAAGLFSFYDVFQLVFFNAIGIRFSTTFSLSYFQLGIFSASFLLANALWLIPGGLMLDRLSPRALGLFFCSCAVLATYTLAVSNNIYLSITARMIQGIASAISLLLCIRVASLWFPNSRGFAIGCMFTMASLGGMSANIFTTTIMHTVGWRYCLYMSGNMGLIFLLFIFLFLELPKISVDKNSYNIILILKITSLRTICLGIYIGLMSLPIFILGALWGNTFISTVYHLPATVSGEICSTLFLGTLIGSSLNGCVNDFLIKEGALLFALPLACLILTLMLITQLLTSIIALSLLLFLLGVLSSNCAIAFAMASQQLSLKSLSTITAIAALIENIIGTISQPMFGWLLDISKKFLMSDIMSYRFALSILLLGFIICMIIGFLIPKSFSINGAVTTNDH